MALLRPSPIIATVATVQNETLTFVLGDKLPDGFTHFGRLAPASLALHGGPFVRTRTLWIIKERVFDSVRRDKNG